MPRSGGDKPRRGGQRLGRAQPRLRPVMGLEGPFPRGSRILKRWEFQRIQREGIRVRTESFTVVARRSLVSRARIGMAVGRKIGAAPVRNRIKRLLREAFRRTCRSLPAVDFVMIAQPGSVALAQAGLDAAVDVLISVWARAAERALEQRTP